VNVLAALASFDATLPDGQLVALAGAPGVERDSIVVRCTPRRGGHGFHAVTWTQNGVHRSAEGSTLGVALRRALRLAGTASAPVEITEAVPAP
jgi:hypothetical protein